GWMVAAADHADTQAVCLEERRRPRVLDGLACADPGDFGLPQLLERVEKRRAVEVERVVVRERHAVDAELRQDLGRRRWGAEEERLPRIGPRGPARRDAALEVQHEEVRASCQRDHLAAQEAGAT